MSTILYTVLVLVSIAVLASLLLYVVSRRFYVEEDPRIDQVEAALPGANCGGCGHAGCRAFASSFVAADDIGGFYCPVGGAEVMASVSAIVGKAAVVQEPRVAVVRCAGSPSNRPRTTEYTGARSCRIESGLYAGHTDCQWGCLGYGDCELACEFDALYIDPVTQLPVIDEERCVACGACVTACPKGLIELRKKGPKGRRVFVSCRNVEKGGVARKACSVACIGCSLCLKECAFEAITVANNLSFIDSQKCKVCRKCVGVCPTGAIWEVNFPPRREKADKGEKAQKSSLQAGVEAEGVVSES